MTDYHVESELVAYLDGELSEAERARVESHLASCDHCAAELERLQALRLELGTAFDAALSPVHLSREAEARIREILRNRVQRPRWWWALRFRWGLFAQAALALLVVLFSLNAYQVLQAPVPVVQETRVLGQQRLAPGSRAALRVVVRDVEEAAPVPDAEVAVRIGKVPGLARLVYTGRTDATGTAQVAFTVPEDLEGEAELVVETRSAAGSGQVVHPITLARSYKLFLTPDKPAYRPGQTLHLRALALDAQDLHPVAGNALTFAVLDAQAQPVARQAMQTSEFGVAALDVLLPEDAAAGTYTLRASLGDTVSERTVVVGDYERPAFGVTVVPERAFYTPGDRVAGVVEAAYFFGKPVANAPVTLLGYAPEPSGEPLVALTGRTGEDGTFAFAFDVPAVDVSAGPLLFELKAVVVDRAGQEVGIRHSVPVAAQPILVRVVPESGVLKPGVENTLFILTAYPDGAPAVTDLTLSVGDQDITLRTDAYGLASYRFVPEETAVDLTLSARDADGAVGRQTFALDVARTPQTLLLRAERATYAVGDTLRLEALASGVPDGQPVYLDLILADQMVTALSAPLVDGRAAFALDLDATLAGSLQLYAYMLLPDGKLVADTRWVVVDAPQRLEVALAADRDVYRPGETARLDIQTRLAEPEAPVSAALGIGIVDTSVYALDTVPAGFARLYFLLDQTLFDRRDAVADFPSLLEDGDAARDLSAKAAWAGAPAPMFTLSALGESQPVVDTTRQRLVQGLSAALILLPLGVAFVAVRGVLLAGLLGRVLRRWGMGLLIVMLASPFLGALVGGGMWLLWQFSGAAGLVVVGLPVLGLLGWLAFDGWRRRDARLQVTVGCLAAYLALSAWLVLLLARGEALAGVLIFLVVLAFLLLVAALVFLGQGLILEERRGLGWLVTALALLLIPLVIYLSFVPAFASDLTQALGEVAFYSSPVNWLTGCASAPAEAPATEAEATEAPAEAVEEAAEEAPTALATQQPLPTATVPVLPPEPYPLRHVFPETLYWNPEALTDAEGALSLEIPLADTITTWRVTALASTRGGDLGAATYDLRVFQDFFLEVTVPEVLVQGDAAAGTLTVYNYADAPQSVRFDFMPSGRYIFLVPPEPLTVAAHDVASVDFVIRGEEAGELALQVAAVGARMEDAVQRTITVAADTGD